MTSNGHDVSTRYLCSIEDTDGCRSAWLNCRYPWYFTDSLHELSESIMTNCNVDKINTILRTGTRLLEHMGSLDSAFGSTWQNYGPDICHYLILKQIGYCFKLSLFCFLKEDIPLLFLHALTKCEIIVTESYIFELFKITT